LGFPIRTSPDHRLLASPRGFSQLATSFFAYLRQGIHTHALSSLTIKLTLFSELIPFLLLFLDFYLALASHILGGKLMQLVVARQFYSVVKDRFTNSYQRLAVSYQLAALFLLRAVS
jgi:hypothetical protein